MQGGKNAEEALCTRTVPMQAKKCAKQLRTMRNDLQITAEIIQNCLLNYV